MTVRNGAAAICALATVAHLPSFRFQLSRRRRVALRRSLRAASTGCGSAATMTTTTTTKIPARNYAANLCSGEHLCPTLCSISAATASDRTTHKRREPMLSLRRFDFQREVGLETSREVRSLKRTALEMLFLIIGVYLNVKVSWETK